MEYTSVRTIASEWHGGQASALYAYASSGTVIIGISVEIQQCKELTTDKVELAQLEKLLRVVEPIENALLEVEHGEE